MTTTMPDVAARVAKLEAERDALIREERARPSCSCGQSYCLTRKVAKIRRDFAREIAAYRAAALRA